jgi:hypothetical protein
MTEEKKEVESSEEDEKKVDATEGDEQQPKKSEEEGTSEEESEFEKKEEFVPANKHNQAVRKLREAELEKRELEKKLAETKEAAPAPKVVPEKKDDSFFEDIEEEEKVEKPETPDLNPIIDEKLKPILERIDKKEQEDRRKTREAWFEANPEYRDSGEKFSELLDVLDKHINPGEGEYYEQLDMAKSILRGGRQENVEIATKKQELAGDAASSGDGAEKVNAKEEFTAEDRKYMKEWNISEEGMRAAKKKLSDGSMRIL